MAKIPLRSYIQEIEGLIDRGQTDEAIAHCKHILRYYPKHIDTYRMLGKAYLESQRYSEAADVLHRVLSVFPDDFVSQIGMSIIREDEGNLDAAIWHMERTFEVQPANTAVQDELRRLYGRRDGVEPPKVRLTRGALARLYARGELYPQAIAEIRAALAEDPERVDLEVILAQTYYASGQKIEATEACSRLVNKLPFCYEANRLLAEILPGTSRAEDTKTYQQRIFALDPYAAYISPSAPTNTQVPDNAVTLDHLDWQPPQENVQQQPEWAKTVGIDLGTTEEALPDWLTPMPTPPAATPEDGQSNESSPSNQIENSISNLPYETAAISPSNEGSIPDWMKTAGWAAAVGGETDPSTASEGIFAEEIAPADIPDWLQSFAPADTPAQEPQSSQEQEKLEILDNILPPQSTEAANMEIPPQPAAPEEILPESTQGATQPVITIPEEVGEFSSLETMPSSDAALPDWLQGLGLDKGFADPEKTEKQQIPDWMQSINEPTQPPEQSPSDSLPDWLSGLDLDQTTKTDETSKLEDELPNWINAGNSEKPVEELPAEQINAIADKELQPEPAAMAQEPVSVGLTEPGVDVDAAMAWLESLAAKQGADQGTLTSNPEERLDTPPEWVKREMESSTLAPVETPVAEVQSEQGLEAIESTSSEPEPSADQPIHEEVTAIDSQTSAPIESALSEIELPVDETIKDVAAPVPEQVEPEPTTEALPMAGIIPEEEPSPTASVLQEEIVPETVSGPENEYMPEIPQAPIDSQPIQSQSEAPQPAMTEEQPVVSIETSSEAAQVSAADVIEEQSPISEVTPAALLSQSDLVPDDGFAWLEALAAKQGADESTLTVAPEDRTETPPAWVNRGNTAPLGDLEVSDQGAAENQEPLQESSFGPDSHKPASLGIDLPDWLQSTEFIEQEEAAHPMVHENEPTDNALPDWLKEIEAEEPASEPAVSQLEETKAQNIPDWLQGLNTDGESLDVNVDGQPVEEKEEALHEWLNSIENNPKQEPEALLVEEPIQKQEPLPEWLQGLDETTSPSLETVPEINKTEEVPVWVNELDNFSGEESKLASTKPLNFPLDNQSFEPEGSFEVMPEAEETAESFQPASVSPVESSTLTEVLETLPAAPAVGQNTILSQAQAALDKGKLKEALEAYNQLISSGSFLDESIHDLRDALYRYPVDIGLWQALGDAYVRGNHLQDALDAYTKAEELLR